MRSRGTQKTAAGCYVRWTDLLASLWRCSLVFLSIGVVSKFLFHRVLSPSPRACWPEKYRWPRPKQPTLKSAQTCALVQRNNFLFFSGCPRHHWSSASKKKKTPMGKKRGGTTNQTRLKKKEEESLCTSTYKNATMCLCARVCV